MWRFGSGRLLVCGALAALACQSLPAWALHWPWQHVAAQAAPAAHVLSITVQGAAGSSGNAPAALLQTWDGDALRVDLTRLRGQGVATLAPLPGQRWPVRLEFQVQPGTLARLEVDAAQRAVFLVPAHGAALTIRLDPGVYLPDSPRMTLRWRAADGSAH